MTLPKETISLSYIKQRDRESLRSYFTKLNNTATIMKTLNKNLVHMAIIFGVNKITELSKDLTKKKIRNLTEFY